jgi:Asp-tRNA(Asn)/Glu-tRNA(Gln) amidotransferase A subunit family amidase
MTTDAWATAEAISAGRLTAVAAVETALDRIAEQDGRVNAFTIVTADRAMAEAREVDAGVRQGPLAGVPISIKDHVWLRGLPATNGSRALAEFVPTETAVCVQRLIDAGAIVVGKTNNPEFCYRGITENELFGATRNPHDPSRTAVHTGSSPRSVAFRRCLDSAAGRRCRSPARLLGRCVISRSPWM